MLCASQKMCREVQKQGLNVAQHVTQQVSMWKSQGLGVDPQVPQTPGRRVAGGPVHPTILFVTLLEQQGARDHYEVVLMDPPCWLYMNDVGEIHS